jgi:D-glutamate cyclase
MTPDDLEILIHRDPAARGLLSSLVEGERCNGQLEQAARSLADGRQAGIVTGFYVPDAETPAAETDGLCGSILLADVLASLQIKTVLITDSLCSAALQSAAGAAGCRNLRVLNCPRDPQQASGWRSRFWTETGDQLTHLIAIERAGPAWTAPLLAARGCEPDETLRELLADIPAAESGRCHNMRGVDIHDWTADLHRLFEDRPASVETIGIGDGGNEIGMGSLAWPKLVRAIPRAHAVKIASSTQTDYTILAGVSDWGAMALAVTVCLHREDLSPLQDWTAERIERTLQIAVREGPAIDGITRRPEPTVDGLPFITYIQPWLHIREKLLDPR